jgi:predicted transposase/invertase (TIGR01784 family)
MRTDTILHQLFLQMPSLLFVLIGQDAEESNNYTFSSVEVKETAFRLDGVLIPKAEQGIIYFLELQFQHDAQFYARLFTEIFLYLRRNPSERDWHAVVVFAEADDDGGIPKQYTELSGRVHRVYLDRLTPEQTAQHPVDILELLILPSDTALVGAKARAAAARAAQVRNPNEEEETLKLLIQILTQKFSSLTYEEARMLVDLNILNSRLPAFEETPFYQEILRRGLEKGEREGIKEGIKEGKKESALLSAERMLREGLADDLIFRITEISTEELAELKQRITLKQKFSILSLVPDARSSHCRHTRPSRQQPHGSACCGGGRHCLLSRVAFSAYAGGGISTPDGDGRMAVCTAGSS